MFFSSIHGTFFKINHILIHLVSLIKFKKIEITSRIFYDHSGVKLEISNQKKMKKKITNMWKLNHMLLNNHWVKEEIKREIRNYLQTNEKENMTCKNLWNVKQRKRTTNPSCKGNLYHKCH